MLKLFHSLDLKLKSCLIALFGSAFLAFGLYHVHSFSGVTEGGVLGMTLLLDHWFHISPSVSGFIMNLACYAMGWKLLGRQFIAYSILSSASFRPCGRSLPICRLPHPCSARSSSASVPGSAYGSAVPRAETMRLR